MANWTENPNRGKNTHHEVHSKYTFYVADGYLGYYTDDIHGNSSLRTVAAEFARTATYDFDDDDDDDAVVCMVESLRSGETKYFAILPHGKIEYPSERKGGARGY